jgi:8-oxo-dGTP diphosphatase
MKLRSMTSLFILENGSVLLLHKQPKFMPTPRWVPGAGGHFEPHELNTPAACLWREVQEELGLPPGAFENTRLRYILLSRSADEIRINYCYFGNLKDGVSRNLSNSEGELRWFGWEEIQSIAISPSIKAALNHYHTRGRDDDCIYIATSCGNNSGQPDFVITPLMAY